mmetsp:Transcript_1508/g.2006  ORF Transcript_1508/g.2006 Transcript_1508/m.2006 type:complete len:153 (-) Transcript_1508:5754-6212(-)
MVSKRSFSGTSNKTGSKLNEQQLAELLSGFLKYEYNYYGYIQGTFKLNENPAASELDHSNTVQRGQMLSQTPQVIALVLNVGRECMGNVFHNPKASQKHKNRLLTDLPHFDKEYRRTLQYILMSLVCVYFVAAAISVFLGNSSDTSIAGFQD